MKQRDIPASQVDRFSAGFDRSLRAAATLQFSLSNELMFAKNTNMSYI